MRLVGKGSGEEVMVAMAVNEIGGGESRHRIVSHRLEDATGWRGGAQVERHLHGGLVRAWYSDVLDTRLELGLEADLWMWHRQVKDLAPARIW